MEQINKDCKVFVKIKPHRRNPRKAITGTTSKYSYKGTIYYVSKGYILSSCNEPGNDRLSFSEIMQKALLSDYKQLTEHHYTSTIDDTIAFDCSKGG